MGDLTSAIPSHPPVLSLQVAEEPKMTARKMSHDWVSRAIHSEKNHADLRKCVVDGLDRALKKRSLEDMTKALTLLKDRIENGNY